MAAAPYGLDIVFATRRLGELFAEIADKDIDDFKLGLVHPAIEMVQEHLLCYRRTLAQAEQFENAVFFAGQMRNDETGSRAA